MISQTKIEGSYKKFFKIIKKEEMSMDKENLPKWIIAISLAIIAIVRMIEFFTR